MKDVVKTGILVGIILVIGFVILFIVCNFKYGIEMLIQNDLSLNEPTVKILYEKIENRTDLRKASFVNTELSSEEIIKYVLDNMNKNDYKKKSIKADKITCNVTNNIYFLTESDKCDVVIINKDVFLKYQKKVFNLEKEITFNDLDYRGYNCKFSGNKYYCLLNDYKDYVLGYSLFKDAYEKQNKIVIHEYYLQINLKNEEHCLKYFDKNYCSNYANSKRVELSEDIIRENGILYEHVFVKKDKSYYLEKSFIVSEG